MRDAFLRAKEAGDLETAKRIARTALDNDSSELRELVDVAIHLRYLDSGLCEAILRHIIGKDPASAYGHYELAFSCLLRGDHLEGIRLLETMLRFHPDDVRAIVLLCRFLCGIGAPDLALGRLQNARRLIPANESVLVEQFAAFIERLPRDKAIYLASQKVFETVDAIRTRIEAALRERKGFSLVRFGDGEGVFFKASAEEERSLGELYRYARADRARVWFGDDLETVMPEFAPLALRIKGVFDSSDVAGVPYRSWIEHEYKILSFTGVVGLGNIARHIGVADRLPAMASQLVHIDLARSGALRAILSAQTSCAIVSCFPEAKDFLMSSFGLKQVEFFKVPGEKLFSGTIGAVAAEGRHFPDVFGALMRSLAQPLGGRLVLVAAGILGKFYCARIKESGGVAIDIGSLVDASLGKATRPGYSDTQRLEW